MPATTTTRNTKIPTEVVCGPFTYQVFCDEALWKSFTSSQAIKGEDIDVWGWTDHESSVILLRPDMSPVMKRVILMHEILHVVSFVATGYADSRDDELEEEHWVIRTAPTLVDVLQRSPGLVKYLAG